MVTVLRIIIDVQKTLLTLKHDRECNLEVKAIPTDIPLNTYKIEIKRTNSTSWYELSANKLMNPWYANIAGSFHLRGMATINGTECYSSNIVVINQFPDYSQIEADSVVRSATDSEWAGTLADCTPSPNLRRERGFWVRINTVNSTYVSSGATVGPMVGPATGAWIDLGGRPLDSPADPAPNSPGAEYSVASFHTHTPTTYRTTNDLGVTGVRIIGPSGPDHTQDYSDNVVGIVYDYIATPQGSGSIPAGHPLASSAQRYHSGPLRRSTP